ncbi:hypothetical protein EDB89DRAFT_2067873 [Lactarius sanguifluus]|nr:hypothetical protein EDB89DRAFT_2067873 [Lactarius sanguifluus]
MPPPHGAQPHRYDTNDNDDTGEANDDGDDATGGAHDAPCSRNSAVVVVHEGAEDNGCMGVHW